MIGINLQLTNLTIAMRKAISARIFITLNGTDAHYTIQNPVTLSGFFKVSVLLSTTEAVEAMKLFDSNIEDANRLDLNLSNAGVLDTRAYGHWSVDGVAATTMPRDGKFHLVEFERDVTDADQSAKVLGLIGCRVGGSSFFNGVMADVKTTDITTPSNSESWQLDRLTANTEQSSSGNNLITYVNIDADARELFTFNQSDGKWNGSVERIPQPIDFTHDWILSQANPTIGPSNTFTSISTSGQGISINLGITGNVTISYNITSGDSNWGIKDSTDPVSGTDPDIVIASSASQSDTIDFTIESGGIYIRHHTTSGVPTTVNSFSIRTFIQIA